MEKHFFITWENHRRTRELASAFGINVILFKSNFKKGFSHISNSFKTLNFLIKERPNLIFVQNPSLILTFIVVLFRKTLRYKVVVDRHTNFRLGKKNGFNVIYYLFDIISNYTLKNAYMTIVTNDYLAEVVKSRGGKPFVLTDKLPIIESKYNTKEKNERLDKFSVVFICTYANDEPYLDVIESAKYVDDKITVFITGNYKNKKLPDEIPSNVILTGFLPQEDYDNLLIDADVVIDFTSAEWCLVCGGYEAVSVSKPFITSDTIALRELYGSAAVYTSHDPERIADSIKYVLQHKSIYQDKMLSYKYEYENIWNEKLNELKRKVYA